MKVLHVVGARPNFMKVAPVMAEMARLGSCFDQKLVHTGQHYDLNMSDVFFQELGLPAPDFFLGVGGGSHAEQTARVLLAFEPVVREQQPDWVVVVGDVNSTLACALVCAKLGIRVAHVEAGLRSYDRTMPEEINRILTDQIADLLLTPSRDGDANLLREGVDAGKIRFVGNVMIDSLVRMLPHALKGSPWQKLELDPGSYVLVTLHRPGNVDDPHNLSELLSALSRLGEDCPVIFPVHPRTRQRIAELGGELAEKTARTVRLVDPLGYLDFLGMQWGAGVVLTDSGGIQEETTYMGVPCLTVRPNTERPVTITQGTNRLVACDAQTLIQAVQGASFGRVENPSHPELWDGQAAGRIVQALMV